jgi:hypothetical protein
MSVFDERDVAQLLLAGKCKGFQPMTYRFRMFRLRFLALFTLTAAFELE